MSSACAAFPVSRTAVEKTMSWYARMNVVKSPARLVLGGGVGTDVSSLMPRTPLGQESYTYVPKFDLWQAGDRGGNVRKAKAGLRPLEKTSFGGADDVAVGDDQVT